MKTVQNKISPARQRIVSDDPSHQEGALRARRTYIPSHESCLNLQVILIKRMIAADVFVVRW